MTAPPRPKLSAIVIAIAGIVLLLVTAACGAAASSASPPGEPIRVVATTTVLGDLVAQAGGTAVSVTSLVPKGGEVHTFDPTPSDLRAVSDADLIVMNGLGLDHWLDKVISDSGVGAPVVRVAEDLDGVPYLKGEEEGEASNPHLWLNVKYAIKYVERIRDGLVTLDPARADAIGASSAAYVGKLETLDAWVMERIGSIPPENRVIVSFHEAFPYFAEAYGLTIVGTIVDAPGQDPSAGEIASLVDAIRESGAKAVFGEVQFSPELVETVAQEAGVVVESDLYNDSLGDPPVDSYEGLIRWDVDKVVAALTAR